MKSTYQIVGAIWDHIPESDIDLRPLPNDPTYSPIGSPFCLFDCDGKRRSLDLTALLAISDRAGFTALRDRCADCSNIAVIVDYAPTAIGRVQQDFYRHRVRQAIHALQTLAPAAEVTLMMPYDLEVAA